MLFRASIQDLVSVSTGAGNFRNLLPVTALSNRVAERWALSAALRRPDRFFKKRWTPVLKVALKSTSLIPMPSKRYLLSEGVR